MVADGRTPAQSHKAAGIIKRPSIPVYPGDFLADTALQLCSLATRGAWFDCLLRMWRDNTYSITGTREDFARLWGCSVDDVNAVLRDMSHHQPCVVTDHHGNVTLMSRRLRRSHKDREGARLRQRRHRKKARGDGGVTPELTPLSSSSSFSPSTLGGEGTPHPTLPLSCEDYEQHPALFILHEQAPELRGITLEQFLTAKRARDQHMDFEAAAHEVARRAVLGAMGNRAPGAFLDMVWSYWEKDHIKDIREKKEKSKARDKAFKDLVAFFREATPEQCKRAETDFAKRYGQAFVDQAKLDTVNTEGGE